MNINGEQQRKYMKCFWISFRFFILMICICLLVPHQVNAEELSGEIEVLISADESEMQKYKEAFEKKYPNVTVKYTTYYDYENEVQERIQTGDYGDVLYVPSFLASEDFTRYLEPLGSIEELSEKYYFWKMVGLAIVLCMEFHLRHI